MSSTYRLTYDTKGQLTKADIALAAKDALKIPLDPDLATLSHIVRVTTASSSSSASAGGGGDVCGLLLIVPHNLLVQTSTNATELVLPGAEVPVAKTVNVALCTHLHVDTKHPKLHQAIFETAIKSGIKAAYYLLPHAGGQSLPVKLWYRPLKIDVAVKAGYKLPIPPVTLHHASAEDPVSQAVAGVIIGKALYAVAATTTTIRPTIATDFTVLTQRTLSMKLDAIEFKRLGVAPLTWVTVLDSTSAVVGVCAYRTFVTKLLIAQLCYFEITSTATITTVLSTLFSHLEAKGCGVVHGAEMGALVSDGVGDTLRLVRNTVVHLHLHHLTPPKHAGEVSLLYI